ncbi:MAG: hypothetical protein BWZ02_02785 [Lentisphaerae bacterium ADurb.BinA184]|nr:MAG: hypothetical protein BWZ02_02785 [Lentisphaerae bacterium ADurb.BinA184]
MSARSCPKPRSAVSSWGGTGLATAMLPPGGKPVAEFPIIIVGPENADPYSDHGDAIEALARHYQLPLPRARCYPYAQRS